MRRVVLVLVLLLGHAECRPHHGDSEQALPTCVKWSNLRESKSLVSVNSMGEIAHTFSSCLVTCLKKDPSLPIIMVAQSHNSSNGHQFVCICASHENIMEAELSDKCDVSCPDNESRVCGNASKELLSVYCTRLSCSDNNSLCNEQRPNCVSATGLDRKGVRHVNVDKFNNFDLVQICSKECKTMNMSLALASDPEDKMCLCTDTIDPDHVVSHEFCDIFGNADKGMWLDVHCVTHEPEHSLQHELGENCSSPLALTCIYDELLPQSKQSIIINTMNEDIVKDGVQKCRMACNTLFPSSSHLAIGKEKFGLECVCLQPNVLNLDLVGPAAAWDQKCGHNECGGNHLHPAKSVYCLHKMSVSSRSMTTSTTSTMSTDMSESALWEERTLARLEAIDESLRRESVLASLIVGLLTFLALLVLALVAYLCHANGVLVLSK